MIPTNSLHWQHSVTTGASADWGEIVEGYADLDQCIWIILTTPKLSVPTEPEKFCDALDYIDRPPAVAIPGITREAWDSIDRWEERIKLDRVEVYEAGFEHFKVPVFWRPREDVSADIRRTVVDLRRAA